VVSVGGHRAQIRHANRDLPDAEFVDPLQGRSAHPTNDGMAISADQGIGDRFGARRTVELRGLGHYFAASMLATLIVFFAASSVPVTVTFFAANFAGVFWSLRT
jgi:hypothetical protein